MEHIFKAIFILIIAFHFAYTGKVCNSVTIKHEKDLQRLKDCTVVKGHVRLTNFKFNDTKDVRSNLEEITDYLIVYRVDELKTLEYIFPYLTIIRGHELLFDKYSLVVYENRDIRDIGLKSLLKIRKGSVQIESNPVLCFVDTVNWLHLLEDFSQQHYSIKDNKDPDECPLCLKMKNSEIEYLKAGCWNLKNFQRKKPIPHINDCPDECGSNGCTTEGKCCSPQCLTGCFAEDCRICKHFKNIQGTCVDSCIIPYYTLGDKCVTDMECRKSGRIPHAGTCVAECPGSYKPSVIHGVIMCNLLCNRNFTIRSKDDLEDVKDCVIIRGSLHIELKDAKSRIIGELENALGGLKEITGYLKITKSPQIVTLAFFKKLDTIKGDDLIQGEIALYVVDNHHLEEIWPENHNVAILKGRIFFHLNPRLCFDKILKLIPSLRSYDDIRVKDVSRNSNGERIICNYKTSKSMFTKSGRVELLMTGGHKIRPLFPVVEDINATAARIKVDPLSSSDKDIVLGYLHYYKEAPVKNVTMFDGRHGCGRDNWQMDMTLNRNIRHILTNLKPYTQYAYFVKTMTMTDYHMQADWYSSIQYFKTLAMKPGPIMKMYSIVLSATAIIVHWWPPKEPNGIISRYLLRYEPVEDHIKRSQVFGYKNLTGKHAKDCDCGIPKEHHGPPPNDLNYYNREQVIVDEAIPNLIFVSSTTIRRLEEERRREDNTRRKRETTKASSESPNTIQTQDSTTEKNSLVDNQDYIDEEKSIELRFRQHLEEIERKSLLSQDTGIEDFRIIGPTPLCYIADVSVKYEKNHHCEAIEHYDGLQIDAKTHSFTLEDLRSDTVYKISVRACVEDLENACGPERSIEVETINSEVEYFLKGP